MSRPFPTRPVLIAAAIAAVVLVALWLRSSDDDAAGRRGGAGGGDDPWASSGGVPGRDVPGAARGRRAIDHDDFGDQFAWFAGTAIVRGRVVDAVTRDPVPGVEVLFTLPGRRGEETVLSEGDGGFTVELRSGEYEVRAVGDLAYSVPRKLLVGRVESAIELELAVTRFATVRGVVVDSGGAPVGGATVTSYPPPDALAAFERDGVVARTATSAADGRFAMPVFPGTVILAGDAPVGHGRVTIDGVPPGGTSAATIVLQPHAAVGGIVRGPDGTPVAGAAVQLAVRVPGARIRQRLTVETGENGRFVFEGVVPGKLGVEASRPGFAPSAPVLFRIEPGERRTDLELVLQAGLRVAGRVVDAEGTPVPEARVRLSREGSPRAIEPVRTDEEGRFAFDDVDAGPFSLTASQGGIDARRDGIAAPADDLEIVLAAGAIRGVVTTPDGAPIREFTVGFERFVPAGVDVPASPPGSAKFVSADGRFERERLEPGRYDLLISAPGASPTRRAGVVVEPGGVADGSVVLGAAGTIAGRVVAAGQPVVGARITLPSGYTGGPLYTDDDGTFLVTGVAAGRRSIVATHVDHGTGSLAALEVAPGAELRVELPLGGDVAIYGIGVTVRAEGGAVAIARVLRGTPASRSRLQPGDRIVAVDGVSVVGMPLEQVVELIRGTSDAPVVLEVLRNGRTEELEIPRARISHAHEIWFASAAPPPVGKGLMTAVTMRG